MENILRATTLRAQWRALVAAIRSVGAATLEFRAELLLTVAFLSGWLLLTQALVAMVPAHIPVWRLSAGLLLLSLCGWKFLGLYFWIGLYTATRKRRD